MDNFWIKYQSQGVNREIYQKIADAFLEENSLVDISDDDPLDEENWKQNLLRQQKVSKARLEEFGEIYDNQQKTVTNKPNLDVVEMDVFDQIKLYQDHTIW